MAGVVVISYVEHRPISESVYFAFITGFTIGYGDIVPVTTIGRIASILLGFNGILFTGLVVAVAVRAVQFAKAEVNHAGQFGRGR